MTPNNDAKNVLGKINEYQYAGETLSLKMITVAFNTLHKQFGSKFRVSGFVEFLRDLSQTAREFADELERLK